MKKALSLVLVFVFITGILCSCSKNKEINVIYPISKDPGCLDPQIAEDDESVLITRNCMEGLVIIGENGEILPGVAESWDISQDGRTYTFHLRENARWQMLRAHSELLGDDYESSFNNSVTADDCAFGIIRALRPETKAEKARLLYCIDGAEEFNNGTAQESQVGITAADSKTLTINLERANEDFIRILTYPMCMPCNRQFFEATGAKYGLDLKYTLCNGPFYVGGWVENSSVTLYKSDVYSGCGQTGVTGIYFNVNSEPNQIVDKFNQKDYNALPVEDSYMSDVDSSKDVVFSSDSNIVYGLVFNSQDSVLSNLNIRKGLICATDISFLSKNENFAGGLIPLSCRWGGKSYREASGGFNNPAVNSENAVKYFYAGLKELEISNINITIICPEKIREDIVRIIQNWQKFFGFSITVTTNVMNEKSINNAVSKGEYQIAFASVKATDRSPVLFLEKFCTENENNIFGYSDTAYDILINKCLYEYDGDTLLAGVRTAEKLLVANGVFYPLYNGKTYFAFRNEIGKAYCVSGVKDIDFSARSVNEK